MQTHVPLRRTNTWVKREANAVLPSGVLPVSRPKKTDVTMTTAARFKLSG